MVLANIHKLAFLRKASPLDAFAAKPPYSAFALPTCPQKRPFQWKTQPRRHVEYCLRPIIRICGMPPRAGSGKTVDRVSGAKRCRGSTENVGSKAPRPSSDGPAEAVSEERGPIGREPRGIIGGRAPSNGNRAANAALFPSGYRDSNAGPPAPKAGALANCATPRCRRKGSDNSGNRKQPETRWRGPETVNFDSICIKHNNKTGYGPCFTKRGLDRAEEISYL